MEEDICALCHNNIHAEEPSVKLREKGACSINAVSETLGENISVTVGHVVHQKCRKNYTNEKSIRVKTKTFENTTVLNPALRSRGSFDFKNNCLFCGEFAKCENKRGLDVYPVRTLDFQVNVKRICEERNDKWSENVLGRLEYAPDLHAADAIYHQQCSSNFRTLKQLPSTPGVKRKSLGRPTNELTDTSFQKTMDYLIDNEEEQLSVVDLVQKMTEMCGENVYSTKYMQKKVEKYFGSSVILSDMDGKSNIVTLRKTASTILHEFYQKQKKGNLSEADEKDNIIATAARLIKSEIKDLSCTKDIYASTDSISSIEENLNFIPKSLKTLLNHLFTERKKEIKIASIGQSIIQASRPRSIIAPLQIGLGVQLHHHFGSRFLIDLLYNLGFCSPYNEIKKYELNSAMVQSTDTSEEAGRKCVQFVADNVDHNAVTLDGHDTFHGMGIIACITPSTRSRLVVPRAEVSINDVVELAKVDIKYFMNTNSGTELKYQEYFTPTTASNDTSKAVGVLTSFVWPHRSPSWSSFSHMVQTGEYPGKSSIRFLPMIDMDPTNISCIYSTVLYISNQAMKHNMTPIVTFDQPLYWKCMNIIRNSPNDSILQNIVLRLGGFHAEMSFLGSIGYIMDGSGLSAVLETIYAPNTIPHLLSGKAVSRAVRGHFLVYTALVHLMKADINENGTSLNVLPEKTTSSKGVSLENVNELYDDLVTGKQLLSQLTQNQNMKNILQEITEFRLTRKTNRTAQLWFQYMDMVDLLRMFIAAERTGNWNLHLTTLSSMLPYLAASGHNQYAKSAHIYLQQMNKLQSDHPDVDALFKDGFHVVRRTDQFWAGISTDLAIEQVLMRSVKTTGGLTRGRGMSENQRAVWLLSMPQCAEMNIAMQTFANIVFETSFQHKESGASRQNRDVADVGKLVDFLTERNPFTSSEQLRNIETGTTSDEQVTADRALEVGSAIIKSMVGQCVDDFVFKRKYQIKSMSSKSNLRIKNEEVQVDPQLLFQRLIAAANNILPHTKSLFEYELSNVPSAIFESSGLMRLAQKSTLLDAIWSSFKCSASENSFDVDSSCFIIDGGSLLHRIPWTKGSTYTEIFQSYVQYLTKRYPNCIVVFDGYNSGPTTKDHTHRRRSKGISGATVNIQDHLIFRSKKELFLSNEINKENFILQLSGALQVCGIQIVKSDGDADLLIVKTAIESAKTYTTFVIGEDTDLVVLLLHHADINSKPIIFKSDIHKTAASLKNWDILKTKVALGPDVSRSILFLHAFTGCDTVSRVYGIGKGFALKTLMKKPELGECASTFISSTSTKQQIENAGVLAMVILYGGSVTDNLNYLRYKKFTSKVLSNKASYLQIQTLPPTSAAAAYHCHRVYLQVQDWIGLLKLEPKEWGWKLLDTNVLEPTTTHLPAAPEQLLTIIRCNCKTDCDNKRCSCRSHGLKCSTACGGCRGQSCTNAMHEYPINDSDDNGDEH